MPGSGKGQLSDLFRKRGIKVIVMSDALKEKYYRDAKPGEKLMDFAKRMREIFGKGVVAKLCIEKLNGTEDVVVIDGVRNWEEIEEFEKVGKVIIIAVHASRSIRYSRLMNRGREDDSTSLHDLMKRDFDELQMGIGTVIALADYVITNDSSIEEFNKRAEDLINRLL
ncbi:hypothetical protein SUSAZ_06140 [Sulfolobus acidocaldarius SUSAZ]|nr:hypothetical protein SUSAZ_06140 [Sulfolobus acidocaldarius SUSAZ]